MVIMLNISEEQAQKLLTHLPVIPGDTREDADKVGTYLYLLCATHISKHISNLDRRARKKKSTEEIERP